MKDKIGTATAAAAAALAFAFAPAPLSAALIAACSSDQSLRQVAVKVVSSSKRCSVANVTMACFRRE